MFEGLDRGLEQGLGAVDVGSEPADQASLHDGRGTHNDEQAPADPKGPLKTRQVDPAGTR